MKCYVLLNHNLTDEQIADLMANFGVTEIIYPSERTKPLWASVPPEADSQEVIEYLRPIFDEIDTHKPDYVVVQGESCATVAVVMYCQRSGIAPLHATTKRESVELPDGKKLSKFTHVRFRMYPRFVDV